MTRPTQRLVSDAICKAAAECVSDVGGRSKRGAARRENRCGGIIEQLYGGMEWVGHSSKCHSKCVQTVSLLRHHRHCRPKIIAPRHETIQPRTRVLVSARAIADRARSNSRSPSRYPHMGETHIYMLCFFQDDLSIPSDFDGMCTRDSALHEHLHCVFRSEVAW